MAIIEIDNDSYHADRTHVSSSQLKLLLSNPVRHYKQYILGEKQEKTDALNFGTYVHALILEPHTVDASFALFEGHVRKGREWDEFSDSNKSKVIITRQQQKIANRIMEAYKSSEVVIGKHGYFEPVPIPSFFEEGKAEEAIFTELGGVKVKVKFDYRKEFDTFGSVNDVKTSSKDITDKREVMKTCEEYDYDLSAALYVDAAEAETGKKHDFYFLFLSKNDGEDLVRMYRASESFITRGRVKYKKALEKYKQCRNSGIWVGVEELE